MLDPLQHHFDTIGNLIHAGNGRVFKNTGDGVMAAFDDARDALATGATVFDAIAGELWPDGSPVRIRLALHTDTATAKDGDYFGVALNRISRLLGTAKGGEGLVSGSTYELTRGQWPEGWKPSFLGERALRDVAEPLPVYQMLREGVVPPEGIKVTSGTVRFVGEPVDTPDDFVGRELELAVLTRLLVADKKRLVTVTGPGGMGKTRLALETTKKLVSSFTNGAVFMDCGAIEHEEELLALMLSGLGCAPVRDPLASLITVLKDKDTLLVFDCCERIVRHMGLLKPVLNDAPGVSCLVTSRCVLGLSMEHELALTELSGDRHARKLSEREHLFLSSAARTGHDDKDDRAFRDAVRDVCNVLDGSPLMITLAASRLRYVSVYDLLEQLKSSQLGLKSRSRDTPAKHSDMRRVIADSVSLLGEGPKRVLGMLTVFVGGFSTRDVDAVCRPFAGEDLDESIAVLRDHSLLLADSRGKSRRFRILDSIREYAHELGPPNRDLRDAYALHYLDYAEGLKQDREAGKYRETSEKLLAEIGNFRAAIEWFAHTDDHPSTLRLARSLARFLIEAALWTDFDNLAAATHRAAKAADRPKDACDMLGLQGAAAAFRGDREGGREIWFERLRKCADQGDTEGVIDTTYDLADLNVNDGNLAEAERLTDEGLQLAKKKELTAMESTGWALMAQLNFEQGQRELAGKYAADAEALVTGSVPSNIAYSILQRCSKVWSALGETSRSLHGNLRCLNMALDANILYGVGTSLESIATLSKDSLPPKTRGMAAYAAVELTREIGVARADKPRRALSEVLAQSGREAAEGVTEARRLGWRTASQRVLKESERLSLI